MSSMSELMPSPSEQGQFSHEQAAQLVNQSKPKDTLLTNHTIDLVNGLFAELQACFPAWRQAFPDTGALNMAKQTWVKAFITGGILRQEQIRAGLNEARLCENPFFPTSGQFIAWCRPKKKNANDAAAHRLFAPALPRPKEQVMAEKARGLEGVQKLRAMLKGKGRA